MQNQDYHNQLRVAVSNPKEPTTKSKSSGTCKCGQPRSAEQTKQFLIKELPATLKVCVDGDGLSIVSWPNNSLESSS